MADRENSTVLLKNADGLLPLDPAKVKSIAVIGWADGLHIMTHGGKPWLWLHNFCTLLWINSVGSASLCMLATSRWA